LLDAFCVQALLAAMALARRCNRKGRRNIGGISCQKL
jgi:hypothetical protein